jgi:hypothetical protein
VEQVFIDPRVGCSLWPSGQSRARTESAEGNGGRRKLRTPTAGTADRHVGKPVIGPTRQWAGSGMGQTGWALGRWSCGWVERINKIARGPSLSGAESWPRRIDRPVD